MTLEKELADTPGSLTLWRRQCVTSLNDSKSRLKMLSSSAGCHHGQSGESTACGKHEDPGP